ncbi:putative secreted protein [Rhodococcus phage Mbo2]|uniref:Secreted protein n=1 Tax=Rhodococcus phage Mbo2 TaxID=2936911 RepID=A0A9E7IPK3_9CAUD|nr:putative secreted protein [Rhodococcus phage Mbo2]
MGIIVAHSLGSLPLVAAGLLQTTNWEGSPNNNWYEIPSANWGASWATYPGTVKSANGLVISGSGLATVKLTTQTSSGTGSRLGRYKINGVANSEDTTLNTANPYVQTFTNVQLNDGDIVIPEYRNNGSISSQRTFSACSIEIIPN